MPQNVRNWWIEGSADGKRTNVAFGPRSADGGFVLNIHQRANGEVTLPVSIQGSVVGEKLYLKIDLPEGVEEVRPGFYRHITERG